MKSEKAIQNYLRKMAKKIRGRQARHRAYREVGAHLRERVEAKVEEEGLTRKVAIAEILATAADPKSLGKKMNRLQKPWILRSSALSSAAVLSMVMVFVVSVLSLFFMESHFYPGLAAKHKKRKDVYELFEKDLVVLTNNPVFSTGPRVSNANEYLNQVVGRSGGVCSDVTSINGAFVYKQRDKDGKTLRYPLGWHSVWKSLESEKDIFSLVDSHSFLTCGGASLPDIFQYDHWNFYESKEFEAQVSAVSGKSSIEKLDFWAQTSQPKAIFRLRNYIIREALLYVRKKQPYLALKVLRHGAHLLDSTRTLRGQSEASELLGDEAELHRILNLPNWQPIPTDVIESYSRASWGWAHVFARDDWNSYLSSRWEKYMSAEVGMCAGLTESPMGIQVVGDFLTAHMFWKSSPPAEILRSREDRLRRFSECGIEELNPLVDLQGRRDPVAFGSQWLRYWHLISAQEESVLTHWPSPSRIPIIGPLVGHFFLLEGTPEYLGPYWSLLHHSRSSSESF